MDAPKETDGAPPGGVSYLLDGGGPCSTGVLDAFMPQPVPMECTVQVRADQLQANPPLVVGRVDFSGMFLGLIAAAVVAALVFARWSGARRRREMNRLHARQEPTRDPMPHDLPPGLTIRRSPEAERRTGDWPHRGDDR